MLVEQLKGRTDKTGQFVLTIDDARRRSPTRCSRRRRRPRRQHDAETAERLYRRVMKLDPDDAAAAVQPRQPAARGRPQASRPSRPIAPPSRPIRASRAAWYNLADLLDDQGRTEEAIDCLARALDADPAYADAMFNMALFLQRLEQHAEAAGWWRRYLALDRARRGPPAPSAP